MNIVILCILAGLASVAVASDTTNDLPAWAVLPDASIEAPASVLPDAVMASSPKRMIRLARKNGAKAIPAASPGSAAATAAARGDDDTADRLRTISHARARNFKKQSGASQ